MSALSDLIAEVRTHHTPDNSGYCDVCKERYCKALALANAAALQQEVQRGVEMSEPLVKRLGQEHDRIAELEQERAVLTCRGAA